MGLENITRMDHGRTHGWWVRFQRSTAGGKKTVTSKLFSDGAHGSKSKALRAAKAWRDAMALEVPAARPSTLTPTKEGYGYLYRGTVQRRVGTAEVWIAWVKLPDGKAAQTSASIAAWGVRGAKQRCLDRLERHQVQVVERKAD